MGENPEPPPIGPRGDMIFAAAAGDEPNDLAFCNCEGGADRLDDGDDFLPITTARAGKTHLLS